MRVWEGGPVTSPAAEYSQGSLEAVPVAQRRSTIAEMFGETSGGATVGLHYPG